jgi:hypothetical protein
MLDSSDFFLFSREIKRLVDDLNRCNDQYMKILIEKEIYYLITILEDHY